MLLYQIYKTVVGPRISNPNCAEIENNVRICTEFERYMYNSACLDDLLRQWLHNLYKK